MTAWRGWYHCMSNTYGTWLPGDPRGFRTRHHREHVEGDYKSPPPAGAFERRYRRSKRLLKRDAVILSPAARRIAVEEILRTLQRHEVQVLALSVGGVHMHVLGRFPKPTFNERGLQCAKQRTSAIDDPVRHLMGIAKQWSSKRLMREGFAKSGIWARRGKIVPIRDRPHQLNVFNYILDHASEGAAVWSFRDENAE